MLAVASTTLDTVKSVAKKPDKKGKRISAQNEPEVSHFSVFIFTFIRVTQFVSVLSHELKCRAAKTFVQK